MATDTAAEKLRGGIYVIIDPDHCGGRDIFDVAEQTASAGAAAIQLRNKDAPMPLVVEQARWMVEICDRYDTLFIVNDYADVAAEVGADGVHVGQGDMPIRDCRKVLGKGKIIGKSNALLGEAIESADEGADYVAVGSIYSTNTKSDTRPAGLATLRAVASELQVPIVAIGGINSSNIAAVAESGADCACVATAVTLSSNPAAATEELVNKFGAAFGKTC